MTKLLHTSSPTLAASEDASLDSRSQQDSSLQPSVQGKRLSSTPISPESSSNRASASINTKAETKDALNPPEVTERDSTTYWQSRLQGQSEFGEQEDLFNRHRHIAYGEDLLAAYHYEHVNQVLSPKHPTSQLGQGTAQDPISPASLDAAAQVDLAIANSFNPSSSADDAISSQESKITCTPAEQQLELEQAAASAQKQALALAQGINQLQDTLQSMNFSANRQAITDYNPEFLRSYNSFNQSSISSLDVPDINSRIAALKAAEQKLNVTPLLNEQEMQDYSFIRGGRNSSPCSVEEQLAWRIIATKERIERSHNASAKAQTGSAMEHAPAQVRAPAPVQEQDPAPSHTTAPSQGGAEANASAERSCPELQSLKEGVDNVKGLLRGLHNLEHSINLLMAILGDGLMLHTIGPNHQRKVLWVNQALRKIYGYSYEQIEKLTGTPQNPQVIHPNDIEHFFLSFSNCARHQCKARDLASVFAGENALGSAAAAADAAATASSNGEALGQVQSGCEMAKARNHAMAKLADAMTAVATENVRSNNCTRDPESYGLSADPDAQFILQDLTTHLQMLENLSSPDNLVHIEYRVLNGQSKQYIWVDLRGVYIGQYQDSALFLCMIKEITTEKKTKDRMERWIRKSEMLSEACQEMVFEYDYNTDVFERFGNYQEFVPAMQRRQEGFLANLPIKDNIHPDDLHILSSLLRDTSLACENKRRTVKLRLCPLGGKEYLWHACSAIGYTEESTGHIKIIGKVNNIHSYESHIASLSLKSQYDPMTHLLNKTTMEQQSSQTLQTHKHERHALLMIDIDNFKQVNDSYGHSFGDEVIKMVASCLNNTFRSTDLVARVGGDEFAVLLKHVSFDQAIALSELYLQILRNQSARLSRPYKVTSSVGIAFYPDDASNFMDLYNAADNALYTVKRQHKGTIAQYNACFVALPTPSQPPQSVLNHEQARYVNTMHHIDADHELYLQSTAVHTSPAAAAAAAAPAEAVLESEAEIEEETTAAAAAASASEVITEPEL